MPRNRGRRRSPRRLRRAALPYTPGAVPAPETTTRGSLGASGALGGVWWVGAPFAAWAAALLVISLVVPVHPALDDPELLRLVTRTCPGIRLREAE